MAVEDILDLDSAGLPGNHDWDRQFRESSEARRGGQGEQQEAERIGQQLTLWRQMLPAHLTPNEHSSPLPHHVIGLAVSPRRHSLLRELDTNTVSAVARYRYHHALLALCRSDTRDTSNLPEQLGSPVPCNLFRRRETDGTDASITGSVRSAGADQL